MVRYVMYLTILWVFDFDSTIENIEIYARKSVGQLPIKEMDYNIES